MSDFKCLRCLKTFPTKSRLIRHINGKKICQVIIDLGGQDLSKEQLKNEVMKANIKPCIFHHCPKCNKSFTTRQNMNKHIPNCQGLGCFLKTKLKCDSKFDGHTFKDKLRSIFYSTYIDSEFKWFKRKGINELYKVYIDNGWTKNSLTPISITNKFFERLSYKNENIK